jgi:hypothetical protein
MSFIPGVVGEGLAIWGKARAVAALVVAVVLFAVASGTGIHLLFKDKPHNPFVLIDNPKTGESKLVERRNLGAGLIGVGFLVLAFSAFWWWVVFRNWFFAAVGGGVDLVGRVW